MDFDWSEEQIACRDRVAEFARRELNDDIGARDEAAQFCRDNWRKCADFGIQGLAVPEEYGGSGQDILSAMLAMEGLGYGCRDGGLALALNAQMWTVQLIGMPTVPSWASHISELQYTNPLPSVPA